MCWCVLRDVSAPYKRLSLGAPDSVCSLSLLLLYYSFIWAQVADRGRRSDLARLSSSFLTFALR